MKINFSISMPFSRPHNVSPIKANFAAASEGLNGTAKLYAVCSNPEHVKLFDRVLLTMPSGHWNLCYEKINQALNQILPDFGKMNDFYGQTCDDDLYDPKFFSLLESRIEASFNEAGFLPSVVVVNMKRWFHESSPRDELGANPQSMRVGLVGLEQYYIRGDVMANWRFRNYSHGDGDLMERMYAAIPNEFLFVPNLFVNWNKLPN